MPEIAGNWSAGERAEECVGHEMLDGSVTYGALRYWSDWLENMKVDLRVEGHDEVLRFTLRHSDPGIPATAADAYEAQVALGFAIADAMLREIGWVD